MNKNIKRFILFLSIIIVIVLGILMLLRFIEYSRKENEKRQWESIEAEEMIYEKVPLSDNAARKQVFAFLINDDKNFIIFDEYLTENFKRKYKTRYDIMPECDEMDIWMGVDGNYGHDGMCFLVKWKNKEKKQYNTRYYYNIDLTKDGQIDDFKLLEKIDVDEYGNRIDGVKEMYVEDLRCYLAIYTCPHMFSHEFDYTKDAYYKEYKDIPLANDCQVLNKPRIPFKCEQNGLNKLKILFDNINSPAVYYKINFDLNDQAQFTKIEYIEITKEEYEKK